MRLPGIRRATISVTCLLVVALAPAEASAARGALSISPGILEQTARPGGLGEVKISNTTARPMKVALAVRPWLQSRSGTAAPNRRKTLGSVRPNRRSFELRAGATRTISLSLVRRPRGHSLYGAIEVTGTPKRRNGRGVQVGYRLVSSLRLRPPPPARRLHARGSRLYVRRGALFLAVKNTGNTIDPIGATVRIRGRGRTLRSGAGPKAILPGRTVNLQLIQLRRTLPHGRYNVSVRLTQAGRGLGTVKRWVTLR